MKKIFTAIGSLLIVMGLKAQVPVKKETTKVPAKQAQATKPIKPRVYPKIESKAVETKFSPKVEHKYDPKAIPKVESNAIPKVEHKMMPKVESKAIPKVEHKMMPKVESKAIPKVEHKVGS